MIVFGENLLRGGKILDIDTLSQGILYFVFVSRHLSSGAAIDYCDLLSPQPQSRAGRINGNIPTTDDHRPAFKLGEFTLIDPAEKIYTGNDALRILTRNIELQVLVGADGKINGFVALFEQSINGHIPTQSSIELYLHPKPGDGPDLFVQNLRRQPVVRYTHPKHAPCN